MTEKEIKEIRNNNPRFENGKSCKLTDEQEKIHKELGKKKSSRTF